MPTLRLKRSLMQTAARQKVMLGALRIRGLQCGT
jgi:hypothetical protein